MEAVQEFAERINRYICDRKNLDLCEIYNQLKDGYPVLLTNAYALDNGSDDFDEDYQILCGESSAGRFLLYDDGLDAVFDAEKTDGSYVHWHPSDAAEALADIRLFMEGTCKY